MTNPIEDFANLVAKKAPSIPSLESSPTQEPEALGGWLTDVLRSSWSTTQVGGAYRLEVPATMGAIAEVAGSQALALAKSGDLGAVVGEWGELLGTVSDSVMTALPAIGAIITSAVDTVIKVAQIVENDDRYNRYMGKFWLVNYNTNPDVTPMKGTASLRLGMRVAPSPLVGQFGNKRVGAMPSTGSFFGLPTWDAGGSGSKGGVEICPLLYPWSRSYDTTNPLEDYTPWAYPKINKLPDRANTGKVFDFGAMLLGRQTALLTDPATALSVPQSVVRNLWNRLEFMADKTKYGTPWVFEAPNAEPVVVTSPKVEAAMRLVSAFAAARAKFADDPLAVAMARAGGRVAPDLMGSLTNKSPGKNGDVHIIPTNGLGSKPRPIKPTGPKGAKESLSNPAVPAILIGLGAFSAFAIYTLYQDRQKAET